MSRKGNSPDNGMVESFFGILKSEMFYGYEKHFRSLEDLEQAIVDYIDYYNNKRIKVKLKGLSPVQYRTKSFQQLFVQLLGVSTLWVGFSLLFFMGQELIDVVHFFSFSFIENSPDDKVDNRKLWNELEIEDPVEGEPTSQSC